MEHPSLDLLFSFGSQYREGSKACQQERGDVIEERVRVVGFGNEGEGVLL
jgi:hypothetical protein